MLAQQEAIPQFVSDEDDPPLQQQGGKHLQEFPNTETLQQTLKVHVLQPGVHRSTQGQNLAEQQENKHMFISKCKHRFAACSVNTSKDKLLILMLSV